MKNDASNRNKNSREVASVARGEYESGPTYLFICFEKCAESLLDVGAEAAVPSAGLSQGNGSQLHHYTKGPD